jgi:predicted PurR-regulated permease PerM
MVDPMAAREDSPHPLENLSGTGSATPSDASAGVSLTRQASDPPSAEPDPEEHPFGRPGPPISRHSPFYRGFWTGLGLLVALAAGLAIRAAESVIVLVIVAIFLAVGLNPIVEWLERKGLKRRWAVLAVTLFVVAVIALFVVSLVPVLRDQVTSIINNAPGWLDSLSKNRTIKSLDNRYHVIAKLNKKLQDPSLAQTAFGSLFTVGIAVLSALLNAFLVFVLTLYFLAALPQIKNACYSLAPASRRPRVSQLGDEILRRVGGYVAGAFFVALCAGTTSFLFLLFAGLGKYALALALVIMVLDFIPLIGATIGATLVSVIGFATSLSVGIACVVFYIVYQQIENYVIYPRIMRSSVDVPGVVTVVAVLLGGTLLGVVGALLAIPLAAACLLLFREVVVRRQDAS